MITVKRLISLLFILIILPLASAPAEEPQDTEPYVWINLTDLELAPGNYGWLSSRLMNRPAGTLVTAVYWESTDTSVVKIDTDDRYTAVGRGQAQLIRHVSTSDGKKYEGICEVRVIIPAEKMLAEPSTLTVLSGGEAPLPEIVFFPEDADIQTYTWLPDGAEIAAVRDGKVIGLKRGTAVLTAVSDEKLAGRRSPSVQVRVTVIPPVESLSAEDMTGMIRIEAGRTRAAPKVKTEPDWLTADLLTWESDDLSVVTVTPEGRLTGIAPGAATVTAWTDRTSDGRKLAVSFSVEVFRNIEQLILKPERYIAFRGQEIELMAQILPGDTDMSSARTEWKSANPYVAYLKESTQDTARIECNQVGQSSVTVTALDTGKRRAGTLIVVEPTVPLSIRQVETARQGEGTECRILFKSRMRQTKIRAVRVRIDVLDKNAELLHTSEKEIRGEFRATRLTEGSMFLDPEEIPPETASIRVCLLSVSYEGGEYSIPEENREPFPVEIDP